MGLEAWQVMLGVMVIPAVLYGLLSFAIPESPRFLLEVGRRDRAREVLKEVEGDKIDLDARVAEIELAMKREHKSTFKDLLGGGGFLFLPIVWVGIGLSVFQQFVGINIAFYYSATLWQSVGVDPTDSFFYSFTTSIINIIGTVIAMIFVDRIGRKPLALIGSVGMAIGLGLEAWAFSYDLVDGKLLYHPGLGRPDRRPRLRPLLRPLLGRRGLGLPGRDVPEPHPRRRARCRRLRAVDRQLGHHRELPVAGRLEPVRHVRDLHVLRRALHSLRAQVRQGDEGQDPGGDGLAAHATGGSSRAPVAPPNSRRRAKSPLPLSSYS